MTYIENYLNDILYPQLKSAGIKYRFIQRIQEDIKNRMMSLLAYWDQEQERNAILLPSLEEALFYEPRGKEDVREFVVTTIRNSMLEIAASVSCGQIKLSEPISDEQVRAITSEAIKFFNQVDFEKMCQELDSNFENVYDIAKEKYPEAWDIIKKLANLNAESCDYEAKLGIKSGEKTRELYRGENFKKAVCDGYTLEFDKELRNIIGEVIAGKVSVFYVDCFKMISRNFEKVLHVLQLILENEKIVCTANYFISVNHLEKRKKILRAAHNYEGAVINLQRTKTAPKKLKEYMENMMNVE